MVVWSGDPEMDDHLLASTMYEVAIGDHELRRLVGVTPQSPAFPNRVLCPTPELRPEDVMVFHPRLLTAALQSCKSVW